MIQIPLEIGDTILTGRFKNKKVTVKEIGSDDYGNPTINGRSILKIRIPKLYQKQENNMNLKESLDDTLIQNVIDTYNHTKSGKMSLGGKREAMTYKKVADKTGFITVGNSGIDYWVMMTDKGIKHFNLKSKNENTFKEANMSSSEMKQRMLDGIQKDGTAFELRGAYGNCELWANGNRLEAGSVKDCYNTWIKYRFNPKYEKKISENTLKEGKAVFVKDRNLPSVLKDSGLSFVEYKEYEDLLLSKTVPELRKLQGLVSKQQDKLRKDNPDPNKWPEHIKRADKQLNFRDMMLMAAVDHIAFNKNENTLKESSLPPNKLVSIDKKIQWGTEKSLPFSQGYAINDLIKQYQINAIAWGYIGTGNILGIETNKQKMFWRDKGSNLEFLGILNKNVTYKTEIKEEVKSFQKSPIEVKIRKDGERFHIFLQTIDGEQQLSIQGYETKKQAEHAAMMKGYKYDGNPYFEKHKGIEVPKATKSEPVKHEKPKEMDLGKEKELKIENFIREVIRMELSKKKVQLKEEVEVNDTEIAEYAKLVDQIDKMKAELSKLTKRFDELDDKFRKMLDVLESELGESKENFIRYKNILITIKRKGYERTNYKYKEAFEELYKKVNANMKKMIDEVLEANKTITKVSSSLSVQYEVDNFITTIFNRVKTWFVSFIGKLRNTNKSTKQLLDQLEMKV